MDLRFERVNPLHLHGEGQKRCCKASHYVCPGGRYNRGNQSKRVSRRRPGRLFHPLHGGSGQVQQRSVFPIENGAIGRKGKPLLKAGSRRISSISQLASRHVPVRRSIRRQKARHRQGGGKYISSACAFLPQNSNEISMGAQVH